MSSQKLLLVLALFVMLMAACSPPQEPNGSVTSPGMFISETEVEVVFDLDLNNLEGVDTVITVKALRSGTKEPVKAMDPAGDFSDADGNFRVQHVIQPDSQFAEWKSYSVIIPLEQLEVGDYQFCARVLVEAQGEVVAGRYCPDYQNAWRGEPTFDMVLRITDVSPEVSNLEYQVMRGETTRVSETWDRTAESNQISMQVPAEAGITVNLVIDGINYSDVYGDSAAITFAAVAQAGCHSVSIEKLGVDYELCMTEVR